MGGLDHVKRFFLDVAKAIEAGDINMVPMGTILMGPPGTGKTALVEAFAYHCGFNFVRIINPRSMLVGESERRYWAALQAVKAMAPVVVVEDEADQSEQSRDEYVGDSGVSTRLRQMRFDFTSDPGIRGKVLWVKLTNRPDKLDVADKRSGRGSERIPLVMPDTTEQEQIFEVMPRKHNFKIGFRGFRDIVRALSDRHGDCISGADIEEISLRAYQNARRRAKNKVSPEDYLWAIDDFIPLHNVEKIQCMEAIAIAECSSRRFLPAKCLETAA